MDNALDNVKKMQVKGMKDIGKSFCDACDSIGSSREMSLAKTRMDEAVLWAVKAITG